MDRSERKVLLVITVITLSLLAFFWWLGNLAQEKKISDRQAAEDARAAPSFGVVSGKAVDADTGEALAGVRILAWIAAESRPPEGSPLMLEAVSRNNGVYVFEDVPLAGSGPPPPLMYDSGDDFFYVDSTEPGTLPPAKTTETATSALHTEPGTLRSAKSTETAETAGGTEPETIASALPLLPLRKGGAIAGLVLGPGGAPCGGAVVLLEQKAPAPAPDDSVFSAPRVLVRTARSDEFGGFGFPRLPAGIHVQITAFHPAFAPAGSNPVGITAGNKAAVSLALTAGTPVAGKVLDAEGKPIAGALVTPCGPPGGRGRLHRTLNLSDKDRLPAGLAARTGPEGVFRLIRPTGETLALRATAPGHAAGYSPVVTAGGDEPAEIAITLPAAARIAGMVRTPDDKPVAGAAIAGTVVLADETYRATTRSDPGGAFTLTPLPAGAAATLSLSAPGLAQKTVPGVQTGNDAVTVVLEPGVRLAGTVTAAQKPVPTFRVFARPAAETDGAAGPMLTAAGNEGAFTLESLAPGAWNLTVSADGFETARLDNVSVQAGPEPATVAVTLRPNMVISGRLLSADERGDEKPLAGARVTPIRQDADGVLRLAAGQAASTGKNGRFSLHGLEAGNYILAFFRANPPLLWHHGPVRLASGGALADLDVTVGAAETAGKDEGTGKEAGGLEVTVLDSGGKPAAGARVEVRPGTGTWLTGGARADSFAAGADGKIVIPVLSPGRKMVAAFIFENGAGALLYGQKRPVTIAGGKTEVMTLSFAGLELCDVAGTIKRGGAPIAGGRVRAVPVAGPIPDLETARFARTDAGGNYAFTSLPAGRYLLSLEGRPPEPLDAQPIMIAPKDGKARLDFDLAAGSISGVILRKAGGTPAAKASVSLHSLSSKPGTLGGIQISAALAGDDGTFAFTGLEAGKYLIAASTGTGTAHVATPVLEAGKTLANIKVALAPAGGIAVTALDEAGKPVRNAVVWARKAGGVITPARRALDTTDGRGRARLHPLDPGDYRLVVGVPGRISHVQPAVKIEPGKTAAVEAPLPKGPQIKLTLENAQGKPVTRCRLAVFGPDKAWVGPPAAGRVAGHAEFTNGAGEYILGGYAAGAYTVHVMARGFRPRTAAFTIPAEGEPGPVAVTLEPAGMSGKSAEKNGN